MRTIKTILKDNSYDIYIGHGLLDRIDSLIASCYKGKNVFIITDSNVNFLYGSCLETVLGHAGYKVSKIVIPAGEQSKALGCLNDVYCKLSEAKADRSSLILAFGGGVVGDLAGFAAATYMRGIPYVQVPTTVMAQLDSSIGGKTAVNLDAGKNLAGCFYQPKAVFVDLTLLESLPQREYCNGLAEAVKYAAIKDSALFYSMSAAGSLTAIQGLIEDIIYRCCSIKSTLVEIDELDKNERQLLNFGHTLGHGLEKYFQYQQYYHGEAVSLGMLQITKGSEAIGLTEKGSFLALKQLLQICRLPVEMPAVDKSEFVKIVCHDKKSYDSMLNLILLEKIGCAFIHKIQKSEIEQFIL